MALPRCLWAPSSSASSSLLRLLRRRHCPHALQPCTRPFSNAPPSSSPRRPYEFDQAMALEPLMSESTGEDSSFRGHISDQWSFGTAPNGGILTSLAISAARKAAGGSHKDPLSVSTHFVQKARENAPAVLRVRRLAAARSQETLSVSLLQPEEEGEGGGRLVARAHFLMTFGTLARFKGMDMNHLTTPALPPPERCVDVMAALRQGADGENYKIADRLELHMPRDAPFVRAVFGPQGAAGVSPQEPCVMEGWARLRDGRWPCLRSMALFNDGFPAPVHSHALALQEQQREEKAGDKGPRPWVWVPTLELTTHFWKRPPKRGLVDDDADRPAPFLRLRFATAFVRRGLLVCDSEVWDGERPTLYSSSRQYARILVPRPSVHK